MSNNINLSQIIRFIFIGGINTLFGFSVYVFFIWYGFGYPVASAISIILGVIFNYFSTGIVVFNHKKFDRIYPYLLVYLFIYIVNISLIALLLVAGLNEIEAGFVTLFPVAVITYYLLNKYVFNKIII
jgi:putative flippase GtrA